MQSSVVDTAEDWPLQPSASAGAVDHHRSVDEETQFRRSIRRQAVDIAHTLVHSAANSGVSRPTTAADMARDLVDAAHIIEDALLHRSSQDQTGATLQQANHRAGLSVAEHMSRIR